MRNWKKFSPPETSTCTTEDKKNTEKIVAYFLFDVETTGLEAGYHEILSLAAIILDDNLNFKSKGYMNLMPNHWDRAQPKALEVNKIDPKTWKASHTSNAESVEKMVEFIDKNVRKNEKVMPMGHNVGFDRDFLKALFKNVGVPWRLHYREKDTIQMMDDWRLFTGEKFTDFRLGSCCSRFGIKIPNAHDASADAYATMQLAHAILADIKHRIHSGTKGIV